MHNKIQNLAYQERKMQEDIDDIKNEEEFTYKFVPNKVKVFPKTFKPLDFYKKLLRDIR